MFRSDDPGPLLQASAGTASAATGEAVKGDAAAGPASFRPNFFIVGAPKCGTTALYRYLAQHPDVFMPTNKEPKFFCPDLDTGSERDAEVFVRDLESYLALFAEANGARCVGEATTFYMYSRDAARNIHAFCPEARIIVMLRNPVDVMYALHEERLYNGNEDIADFQEALQAAPERKLGRRLPPRGSVPSFLQYREVVRFSGQLERYLEQFGRENVHVIIFDDFVRDTEACYRAVLAFLELSDSFLPSFEVVNPSKKLRSRALAQLMRRPPPGLRSLVRAVLPPKLRLALTQRVRDLNTKRGARPPLDPELRRGLLREYREEVERLGYLIGRDLSRWTAETA
ncbi:MAG TPA: sulfotransferase [Chloroflexota bacterium]|nr:sulfotransferase [Chloroflexota bacterium]